MISRRKSWISVFFAIGLFLAFLSPLVGAQEEAPSVLGMKDRAEVFDSWLRMRLDNVLPEIMRRENIDMWVVICREYNEDPVYLTLVPSTSMSARRLSMLVFYDKGKEGIEPEIADRIILGKGIASRETSGR